MDFSKISRQLHSRATRTSFVVGVVVILILVNLISLRYFVRLDLTQERQYTLSDTSLSIVSGLDDVLTIKVYFSKTLPPELANLSQYVRDILTEYQAYSSNVTVEYIDPAQDPKGASEVEGLGIPQVRMNFYQKDKVEVQNGYLGLGFFYSGRKEIIPVVSEGSNLEYEITTTMKKVGSAQAKKVAFLTGDGEPQLYAFGEATGLEYLSVRTALEKLYTVQTLTLNNGVPIQGFDTLVVAGTNELLTERELYEIDQFIMQGGNVIFLIDPIKLVNGLQAEVNSTGLEKLLKNLGVDLHSDLVLDESTELVTFSTPGGAFMVPYYFWVKATNPNFASDNPVVSKVQSATFEWVSSLGVVNTPNVTSTVLMNSSTHAWHVTPPYNLDPGQKFQPPDFSQYPLAVLSRGKFKSLYPGQKPPAIESSEASATPRPDDATRVGVAESEKESSIIVVGDSDFINDRSVERFPENLALFSNMVDYITLDPSLISIRAKGVLDRPVNQVSDAKKQTVKLVNMVGVPAVVVVLGVARLLWRKKRRYQQS